MSISDYIKAKKLGEASYREYLNQGRYPYLTVLDEILNHVNIISETSLGVTEIPVNMIQGTYAAGRRTAFAPNFMPLLSEGTEFADKWSLLFDSLEKEGLRDPIKAYEYMNRFYVMEGNKRVSVMKCLGAVTIPGTVIRLIPERNDSDSSRLYSEYLWFYKLCPENYMIFSQPGSYMYFLTLTKKELDHVWTEEEMSELKSIFYRFRNAYYGEDPALIDAAASADAFLSYLSVYDYNKVMQKSSSELKAEILSMKEELKLSESGRNIQLMMNEDELHKHGLLGFLSRQGTGSKVLHVDFVHDKDIHNSSWTYLHELGKNHVENHFGDTVVTRSFYNVEPGEEIDVLLNRLGEEGSDIVFTTSRIFLNASLKAAVKYPETRYLCCTLNAAHRYIRTYYARLFEVKFLLGVIAGASCEDGKIGYIADLPIPSHIANLNAFALGVQMVHPSARIYVEWLRKKDSLPSEQFRVNSVHTISGREMMNLSSPYRDFGLYQFKNGRREELALALWNWGVVYQKIIESVQSGAFDEADENANSLNALNYWWGIPSDAIDLFYSRSIPAQTIKLVELLKNNIRDGSLPVFSGKIESHTGTVLSDPTAVLTPEKILTMDWLLSNIVGEIPDISELDDHGTLVMQAHRDLNEKLTVRS